MYVGKTTIKLKRGISELKSVLRRNDSDYPIAVHFTDDKQDISTTVLWHWKSESATWRGDLDLFFFVVVLF